MNIANKNSRKVSDFNLKSSNYGPTQAQFRSCRRDSVPISSVAALHYAKRQSCPNMNTANQIKYMSKLQDQSTVAHTSTKGIDDSRKSHHQNRGGLDWKILTLKQIRDVKGQIIKDQKMQQQQFKDKKIFVSISKNNRSAASKQKYINASPKLAEIGGEQTLLRSFSNKRNIVNRIEFQMDEGIRNNQFFCN